MLYLIKNCHNKPEIKKRYIFDFKKKNSRTLWVSMISKILTRQKSTVTLQIEEIL